MAIEMMAFFIKGSERERDKGTSGQVEMGS